MTRFFSSIVLAATMLSACGQYTNLPARIHPSGESNLLAEVSYAVDQNKVTATVKNPTLVLQGEPGSVGATFNQMQITYTGVPANFEPKQVQLSTALRVDSSHRFEKDNDSQPADAKTKLLIGKGNMELPIVNGAIVSLGSPSNASGSIASPISAVVILSGTDDAGWPVYVDIAVPVNFIRVNQ